MTNRKLHVRFRWHQGQWLGWPWTATSLKFLGISFDFADLRGKTAKRMMIDPIVIVAPKCTFQQRIFFSYRRYGDCYAMIFKLYTAMVTINVKGNHTWSICYRFRRCWPS